MAANQPRGLTGRFTPYIGAATKQDIEKKLQETVSIQAFGAVADTGVDNSAAFAAAVAWLSANPRYKKLVFPAGNYTYSVSPNWAIKDAIIVCEGNVFLTYTGTGQAIIIDAGTSALCYNLTFGTEQNQFILYAASTTQECVYIRSVHHSKIAINVRSGGPTYAAVKVAFSVCTSYYITVSGNQNLGVPNFPFYGLYLTQRNVGEKVSDCVFHNAIIEGTGSWGIYLDKADKNIFLGGTSEANGGGVLTSTGSLYNTFMGMDLELNGASGDISEGGFGNMYLNCLSTTLTTVVAAGRNAVFKGGQYNSIVDNGVGSDFDKVEYNSTGTGTFTGTAVGQSRRGVMAIPSLSYENDKSTGSFETTTSCNNAAATTCVTLPSTAGNRLYTVHAYIAGTGSVTNYGAFAQVLTDGATAKIFNQNNGALLTITLSGMNIQVTQSSGAAANVVVRALKM